MKLPFFSDPPDFAIETLSEDDAHLLPDIHAEHFSRPWSEDEFLSLLTQEPVFGFAAWRVGNRRAGPAGFVLARFAAGEGEILTVAVLRAWRGRGLGRDLMEAVLRELHARRAEALFLEVDEANGPAMALYRRLGFRVVGRRPAYYGRPDAPSSAALVMRRDLRQPAGEGRRG